MRTTRSSITASSIPGSRTSKSRSRRSRSRGGCGTCWAPSPAVARILVIDDDALLRGAIRVVLESAGYEVIEAGDGGAGLRLYREQGAELLLVALGRCSDSTAPTSPVTVTVTASLQSILPGQSVGATVTVVPPGNAPVDFVKIATSGVYTSAESLSVHLTGTFTATRFYSIPASAGTGTHTILATAAAGGATGNGETRVAVADTVPPVIPQFSVSPADSAQPGDSLTVTLTMGDNAALRYSIIRLSGPVTLKDSVDHAYPAYAS